MFVKWTKLGHIHSEFKEVKLLKTSQTMLKLGFQNPATSSRVQRALVTKYLHHTFMDFLLQEQKLYDGPELNN